MKDCTKFGPRSIQSDMIWDRFLTPVAQDESNCLNMAIYAPNWKLEEFVLIYYIYNKFCYFFTVKWSSSNGICSWRRLFNS